MSAIWKNACHNFTGRWNFFGLYKGFRFGCLSSALLFGVGCIVMNPCFIHRYETARRICSILPKHTQAWNVSKVHSLFRCEQTRYPTYRYFFMFKILIRILYARTFDVPALSKFDQLPPPIIPKTVWPTFLYYLPVPTDSVFAIVLHLLCLFDHARSRQWLTRKHRSIWSITRFSIFFEIIKPFTYYHEKLKLNKWSI